MQLEYPLVADASLCQTYGLPLELWVIFFIIIIIISNEVREVTSCAGGDAAHLYPLHFALLSDFILAARAASHRTVRHLDFSRCPIYLRVMLLKPGMPEDEVLIAYASESEQGVLRVILVPQDKVNHLSYVDCLFIRGTINIVHWYGI